VVRKEPKKHGKQKFIEGLEQIENQNVVILDDVCTKGDSTKQAIDKAEEAGMRVIGAVCLVDRESGATELLAQKGIRLAPIFTLRELIAYREEIALEHTHSR